MENNFVSLLFDVNVNVEQESTLSLILSSLYISLIFHIFEKRTKNLISNIYISFLSFVDNDPFISQKKPFKKLNTLLYCSYNIITSLFNQFSLIIKHRKLEIFYFSRLQRNFDPLSFDLSIIGGPILWSKNIPGFIFDRKLSFQQHIYFYFNKAFSAVKGMKILGNLTQELLPHHK